MVAKPLTSRKFNSICGVAITIVSTCVMFPVPGGAQTPTQTQLWQTGKAPLDSKYDYFQDVTDVPENISYVKIQEIGFSVSKQFPIVFISDAWIEVNSFRRESDTVMSRYDLSKVAHIASGAHCISDISKKSLIREGALINSRDETGKQVSCYVPANEACEIFYRITNESYVHYYSYNLSNVKELRHRFGCNKGA